MITQLTRRDFLSISSGGLVLGALSPALFANQKRRDFKISLNERSFHHSLKGGTVDHLDFAATAKKDFDIDAIEYVSSYFSQSIGRDKYVNTMNRRAAEHGVRQVLIDIDDQGALDDSDEKKRMQAIMNHQRWIDLAKTLGCHSVCVRLTGEGFERGSQSLEELAGYAQGQRINILVCCERPGALVNLLNGTKHENLGTYPCFAHIAKADAYDALGKLIPFAKGVCATSKKFDKQGNETSIDFFRMVKIVLDAGYRGHMGIRFQGTKQQEEHDGIVSTKKLLITALHQEMRPQKN